MTTRTSTTAPAYAPPVLGFAPFDESVERAQQLSDRMMVGARSTALTVLDAYDRSVRTLADLQVGMVDGTVGGPLSLAVRTQTRLAVDLTEALTRAARSYLTS